MNISTYVALAVTTYIDGGSATSNYTSEQISGSAIGLLTLGVLQSKPKCSAVMVWIQSIWTEYYTRKTNGSFDNDYTSCGSCPHTIPELMAEVA